jgi:hypothetical protein
MTCHQKYDVSLSCSASCSSLDIWPGTCTGSVQQGSQNAIEAVKKSITDTLKNLKPQDIITSIMEKLTDVDAWVDFLPEPRNAATSKAVVASTQGAEGEAGSGDADHKPKLGRRKLSMAYVILILFELQEAHPDLVIALCLMVLLWCAAAGALFAVSTGWKMNW